MNSLHKNYFISNQEESIGEDCLSPCWSAIIKLEFHHRLTNPERIHHTLKDPLEDTLLLKFWLPHFHLTGIFVNFIISSLTVWTVKSISEPLTEFSQGHTLLWSLSLPCPCNQSPSINMPGAVLWMEYSAAFFSFCFLYSARPIGKKKIYLPTRYEQHFR